MVKCAQSLSRVHRMSAGWGGQHQGGGQRGTVTQRPDVHRQGAGFRLRAMDKERALCWLKRRYRIL